jgi:hypothetical protein
MAKSRASFVKRQREIAKKEQRAAKLQRKLERRAAPRSPDTPEEVVAEVREEEQEPVSQV